MSESENETETPETGNRWVSVIITLLCAAVVGLGGFWFGSIASDKDLQAVQSKQEAFQHEVKTYYATKDEVQKLDAKMNTMLMGMCIIDERTCKLREKKGK